MVVQTAQEVLLPREIILGPKTSMKFEQKADELYEFRTLETHNDLDIFMK